MDVKFFETVIVSPTTAGDLLIAFIDGSVERGATQQCVALLACTPATAAAMRAALGSALKSLSTQSGSEN